MHFDFRSVADSTTNSILISFSVDGAELNASAGAIFGFLRVLNQVDYIDSPLMQFPVLLAQTSETREFYAYTLPDVLKGLIELSRTGVDVVCVDEDCPSFEREVDHTHR